MTSQCKIVGCRERAYQVRLCEPHYDQFIATGMLPGDTKRERPAIGFEGIAHRAENRGKSRWYREKRAFIEAADGLADAAAKLPDAVRTHALRSALGRYTAARAAMTVEGVDDDG